MHQRLARLSEVAADDLASYTTSALQCFWAPAAAAPALGMAQVSHQALQPCAIRATCLGILQFTGLFGLSQEQAVPREGKGEGRLPLSLQAATARAQLALEASAPALLCLLRAGAPRERAAPAARAVAALHGAAVNFLHCFATTPILYWGGSRCACQPAVHTGCIAGTA